MFILPFTNLHELNLDWIIQAIKSQEDRLTQFVSLNSIKYANPFQWDITSQYAINTLVIDPQDGTAYLSVQPVPSGVQITNTEYWTPVFTLQNFTDALKAAITDFPQQEDGQAATREIPANSVFFVGDILCTNAATIPTSSLVVIGTNCTQVDVVSLLSDAVSAEATAREQADTALGQQISAETEARQQADTQLGQQISNETEARQQADTQLGQQISDETEAREQADTALQQAIANVSAALSTYGASASAPSFMYRIPIPVSNTYRGTQGICVIDENTQIVCTIDTSAEVDTLVLTKVINNAVSQKSTINTEGGFGHANSATYNRTTGEMLLAGTSGLCRINVNTLAVIDYVELGTVTGVSYDPVKDVVYVRNAGNYRVLNPSTYAVEKSFSVNEPTWVLTRINQTPWITARQGLVSYNGLVGCLYYNPNIIIFYDENGDVQSVYNFPYDASRSYIIRELEDGDFLPNGVAIFDSNGAFAGKRTYRSLVFSVQFSTNQIYHVPTERIDTADTPTGSPNYFYVSAGATGLSPDGSSANPFQYVQEAIEAATLQNCKNVIINLVGAGNFGALILNGVAMSVRIVGDNENQQIVEDVSIERTTFADLRYLTARAVNNAYGAIQITSARASLVGCTISGGVQTPYGVSGSRCIYTMENLTIDTTVYSSYAIDMNTSCIADCAGAGTATIRLRAGTLGYTNATSTSNITVNDSVLYAPNAT